MPSLRASPALAGGGSPDRVAVDEDGAAEHGAMVATIKIKLTSKFSMAFTGVLVEDAKFLSILIYIHLIFQRFKLEFMVQTHKGKERKTRIAPLSCILGNRQR